MDSLDKLLLFFQIISIVAIWIRLEGRISMLEGRFDTFIDACREKMHMLPIERGPHKGDS